MKKILIVIALAAILATGTAFADHPQGFGIGVVGGYFGGWESGRDYTGGAALSLKLSGLPIYWAVRLNFAGSFAGMFNNYFGLNVSGDYYFMDRALIGNFLHWYLGLGAYVSMLFTDPMYIGVGARVPIGLSIQLFNFLEIFAELPLTLGVTVSPGFHFPDGGWGASVGVRLWF
jgi:opacity protein-like surface antigen